MSRLNRAFIKAFERDASSRPDLHLFDAAALSEAPVETETRVEFDAGVAAPVLPVQLPTFNVAPPPAAIAPVIQEEPTEPVPHRWTPPLDLSGPQDWRSALHEITLPEIGLLGALAPTAAAASDPTITAPPAPERIESSTAKEDAWRFDDEHPRMGSLSSTTPAPADIVQLPPLPTPWEIGAASFALESDGELPMWTASLPPTELEMPDLPALLTAQQGVPALGESSLQVDRFEWPAICISLIEQAESAFDTLAEALWNGGAGVRKLLAVTGYRRGAGRTTVLLTTARALAARGARVALVDGEWDNPRLAERLGVAPETGWQDILASGQPLEEALIESLIDGVTLLPARQHDESDGEVDFDLIERHLYRLREAYDFVLVDAGRLDESGPRGTGARILEELPIDGVLLVHDVSTSAFVNPAITEKRFDQLQIGWWRIIENFAKRAK